MAVVNHPNPGQMSDYDTAVITLHRTELIPGGNGAMIGYSDDFPDRQFLILPNPDPQ